MSTTPEEAERLRRAARHVHDRGALPSRASDLLFYEGLHGAVVTDKVNIAQYADLKIGVVPVINLEWIQKLHRDRVDARLLDRGGDRHDPAAHARLRHYICPQFAETDINFQRVPTVDTSNPFIARWIPTPDESMVVIRFRNPRGIDFPYLRVDDRRQLHVAAPIRSSFPAASSTSRMQLILTPMILQLVERRRRAI